MFEIVARDACGRIGKLKTRSGTITTPALIPVYNPNIPIVSTREFEKEFKAQVLMTNAYIVYRDPKLRVKAKGGIHRITGFHGPVMTDSGAYQAWVYGKKRLGVTNSEIIKFEEELHPDVATILDVFTATPSYEEAKRGVEETISNAVECTRIREKRGILWAAPVQGGQFLDLLRRCAKSLSKLEFDVHPLGTLTPSLMAYEFKDLAEMLIVTKLSLTPARPIHAFGVGHPMVFSLAVGLGADLFDSAAYALFAKDLRYMTTSGTRELKRIDEFPCHCPVCSKYSPKDLMRMGVSETVRVLAKHNLYVSFAEMRTIRQAIRENRLWELIQERARSHPKLLNALRYVLARYKSKIERYDPTDKKSAFFYSGVESSMRPEVVRLKRRLKRVSSDHYISKPPFGLIPYELKGVYPFAQSVIPEYLEKRGGERGEAVAKRKFEVSDESIVRKIVDYQFGRGASRFFDRISVERSKRTGRMRYVYSRGKLIGTLRPSDGFIVLTVEGGNLIKRALPLPKARVVVSDEAIEFVRQGKSVFAGFVRDADPEMRPGDEALIVNRMDDLLGVGKAKLNREEMISFSHGVAVKTRSGVVK